MPFGFHPSFLIILLVIVLIIFGPGKLPELGSAFGRTMREFRKASDEITNPPPPERSLVAEAGEPAAKEPKVDRGDHALDAAHGRYVAA